MAFAAPPITRAWSMLGRIGGFAELVLARTPWKLVVAAFVMVALGKGAWATVGGGPAALWTTLMSMLMVVVLGRHRYPQAVGVLAASVVSASVMFTAALLALTVDGIFGVPFHLVLIVPMLVVVSAAVFVAPHKGVHVGWSVALAQGTVLLSVPVVVIWPDSDWSALIAFTVFVAALVGVYFRSRHAHRVVGRWRRAARLFGVGLVAGLAAITIAMGAPGQASGFFGIGDMVENKVDQMICNFTRPDLAGESIGTGPETMFPSRNFGQVSNIDPSSKDAIPANLSREAGNFDRLGTNNALDAYTLYEIAGLRGLKYVNWQKNPSGEEICSIMPWVSVTTGNIVMSLNTYILQFTIFIKETSQSGRPFESLYDKTLPMVDALFNGLFLPASGLMFTIAGLGMLLASLRSRGFREGIGEVGGVAGVLLLGGLLFGGLATASWTNPGTSGFFILGSALDQGTSLLNSQISEATFKSLDLDGNGSMCKSPQPVPARPGDDAGMTAAAPGQRYSSCILAESLAYRPWAVGQFGAAGETAIRAAEPVSRFGDPRINASGGGVTAKPDAKGQGVPCYNNYNGCADLRSYLIAQSGGPDFDTARRKCMEEEGDYTRLIQCDPYHAVANQLNLRAEVQNSPDANAAAAAMRSYTGSGRFPHLTQALVALIATMITAAGIGLISVISMWWQFMLFILFITGIWRLLYAAFPGKASAARDYVGDFAQTFIMRLGYGLLSLLMIVGVALILGSTLAMGVKILFIVLLLFGLFRTSKKLQEKLKVQGSTFDGPMTGINRTVGGAAALGGYGAVRYGPGMVAGAAGAVTGAAGAAGRGARWATTRTAPSAGAGRSGPDTSNGSGFGSGSGSGSGSGGGSGQPSVTGPSPIGRAAAATRAGGRAAGTGVGRVAGAMVSPFSPALKNAAGGVVHKARMAGIGVDRALGARLAPARRATGQATQTAAKLTKNAATNAAREGLGAVSLAASRQYSGVMPERFKTWADNMQSSTKVGQKFSGRQSFAEADASHERAEQKYAAVNRARRMAEQKARNR